MMMLTDTHIHLDLMDNGAKLAREAGDASIRLWNMTTNPKQYMQALEKYVSLSSVHCGLGLHPHIEAKIEEFQKLVHKEWLIGEIGLDFSKRAKVLHTNQIENFQCIIDMCSQLGNKILSVHSIRTGKTSLDILEDLHAFDNCIIIFHWFSESCDSLHKAIQNGAYFSINKRMLQSKRGKEYAKAIPLNRILLETDFPAQLNSVVTIEKLSESFTETITMIAQLHNTNAESVAETIFSNTSDIAPY